MTDIERLKDFVSSEILPEINALISYLGSERITTVEGFAAMSGKTLKDMWNITPPALVFDKFYERISLLTRDLMNDYIIGDIDNPSNPREKSRADHVWSAFHNKFSGMRAVVVRNLTNEFLVTYPLSATGHSFAAFFALDNPNLKPTLRMNLR